MSYYCPFCDSPYDTENEMFTHLKGQHPEVDFEDWYDDTYVELDEE